MKFALIMLTFSIASPLANATELIDKMTFTQKYTEKVEQILDDAETKINGELEVAVSYNGLTVKSYLHNAYEQYQTNPDQLTEVMETYAASLKEIKNYPEVQSPKTNIVPVIKSHNYIQGVTEMVRQSNKNASFPFYYEQLNSELYVLYAIDSPSSIDYLSMERIEELKINKEDLRSLATQNLWNILPSINIQGEPKKLSMLVADGNYEASLLLLDDLWNKEQFPVKGEIIVYVPTRNFVLITGSNDQESIKNIKKMINDPDGDRSHSITTKGFIRKDGSWEIFSPK